MTERGRRYGEGTMYRAPTALAELGEVLSRKRFCRYMEGEASVVSRKYMKEGRVTSGAEALLLFNRLRGS